MNPSSISTGRHLLSGTFTIFFAETLILPTGFVTAVFLARQLGPVNYGLFALVSMVVIWIEWSSPALFAHTTIKFVGETSDWRPIGTTVTRLHLMISSSVAVLLWLLSSPLSYLFKEPAISHYLKIFAIDIPIFSLASANRNILVGMGCFKEQARIRAGRWIARMVLIVLFVEMGLSVTGAIMGTIGASIIELLISWIYVRPSLFSVKTLPIQRLWGFVAPLFMSALCIHLFRMDLFALKALGGTAAQAGFYSAALNISIPPAIFSSSFSSPLLSTLSRLFSEKKGLKANEIGLTAIRSIFWLLPLAVMIAGTAPEIICFIFGRQYLPATPVLALLIFAVLGLHTVNIVKVILIALNKPIWTFTLTGPMVPLALIGYLVLIPRLDGVGAAVVVTVVAWIGALAALFAVYRILGTLPPIKTILRCILCSGISLALAILWPVFGLMIILKLMIIILFILFVFVILGEFTSSEINLVRTMLISCLEVRKSKDEIV